MLRRTRLAHRIATLANLPHAVTDIDNALRRVYAGSPGDSAVGDKPIPGLDQRDLHRLLRWARREMP